MMASPHLPISLDGDKHRDGQETKVSLEVSRSKVVDENNCTCGSLQSSPWKMGGPYCSNTLYVSHKERPHEQYLAKIIPTQQLSSSKRHKLVSRLLQFKHKLNFEFLLKIVDVVEDSVKGRLLVVTEYCEGGTLQCLMSRAKSYDEVLNEIEVKDWLTQILSALRHLDQQDLVHKDICSNNILLKQNCVRICEPARLQWLFKKPECLHDDFNDISETDSFFITEDSVSKDCDWSYTAPEVLDGKIYTHKADVWSAGCVLYELCARKKLFKGKTAEEIRSKITIGKFCKAKWPGVFSSQLQHIWSSMMEVDPMSRPSASDILKNPEMEQHYQDMLISLDKMAKLEEEMSEQTQTQVLPEQIRFEGLDFLCDSEGGIDADLELTEEETMQLLNLGRS